MKLRLSVFTAMVLIVLNFAHTAATEAMSADPDQVSNSKSACTDSESWTFSSELGDQWKTEFQGFLSKKHSAVRGFSQGLALRRQSQTHPELKLLGEYWISRALLDAKMVHVAYNGFSQIASNPLTHKTKGVQIAAMECLNRIHQKFPALPLPQPATAKLQDYFSKASTETDKVTLWEYTETTFHAALAEERPKSELQNLLGMLKGSGPYEALAKGAWLAKQGGHSEVIAELQKFISAPAFPKQLKRFTDQAHLLMARSYYNLGYFEKAAAELKGVSKSSNDLAETLSELAWSHLQAEHFSEAIGATMNLQAGGLRHTFMPEAPMVMAMALNELCQFPESLKAVNVFKHNYEKSFRWLDEWNKTQPPLYSDAVQFLRKQSQIPDKIGTEWLRSPLFLSHQDELNLLFDERESSATLSRTGAKEQRRIAAEAKNHWEKLKPKIRTARAQLKPGEEIPLSLKADIMGLKYEITAFRRFWYAAPAWQAILNNHEKLAPQTEKRLVKQINHELSIKSQKMFIALQEIAENNQLIEVEIYNGASQDIIWQNAHPDYKDVARKMQAQAERASRVKVWDWGRTLASTTEEAGEIWEDELGSFKADLYDNCSSKDKYLAIKQHK